MRKKLVAALAASAAVLFVTPRALSASDEVTPAEDNPPGCTTAGIGNSDQCGAQGRNNFNDANHVPPIEECKTRTLPAGSTITRILPNGPRRADNSLAFIPGACVYLPPGYATSGLRYPVLYMLHGGGGDEQDWVNPHNGDIATLLDDVFKKDAAHAVIAVMPDGYDGNWHDYNDGSYLIEQYVLGSLVPYVDAHFRTIADRRGRAVDGLSNGGYGALLMAAKAPDLFVAAGGMSSNVGGRSMSGLGTHWLAGNENVQNQEFGAFYYGNTPTPLASNLDNVDVTMDIGGECTNDADLQNNLCLLASVDALFRPDNEAFRDAMTKVNHIGAFEYRAGEGTHRWYWWTTWFRDRQLPFIFGRLAKPTKKFAPSPLPTSFRYRSISPQFSIYGYSVTITRDHPEFFDLTDVSEGGLTLTGTGTATIVTPARYLPNATYSVDGVNVQADHDGKIRFTVDLGASHADEQYGPAARAEEAAGQYSFVTKQVTITRVLGQSQEAKRGEVLPRTGGSAQPLSLVLLATALLLRRRTRVTPLS
jgi:diacylglycerol O-acyltransferase / trehalose O-mycolyltransferase